MKFKNIYIGYTGIVCGFDPVTNQHLISMASGYDLYNADGENLFTKEILPVCHISGKGIEVGKKGVTLNQASKIFSSIDPEAEFDEDMVSLFKKLITDNYMFTAINKNAIASELNQVLNNKKSNTTTKTKLKLTEKLFSLKKSKKQTAENENDITI